MPWSNTKRDPYIRPPAPTMLQEMAPFITGSRAYGQPTKDSDVDVVVFMDEGLRNFLRTQIDPNENPGNQPPNYALRFGQLNLICCVYPKQYEAWRRGTLDLIKERPVTRERAIEVLEKIREGLGVEEVID
jgi:hypothetical protein